MGIRDSPVPAGKVTEGLDVLKSMEKVGSQSGSTSTPVIISDCGQIA